MRVLVAVVTVAVVLASQTEVATETNAAELDAHYDKLDSIVHKDSMLIDSAFLAEVHTHLAVKNPMQLIFEEVKKMTREIRGERKTAIKKNKIDRDVCKTTLGTYTSNMVKQTRRVNRNSKRSSRKISQHRALAGIPGRLTKSRAARNATCVQLEKELSDLQDKRDKEHQEFLNLREAFEFALGNVSLIRRVLNGEGSLGDLAGQSALIEKNTPCSVQMHRLSSTCGHQSVSVMLQTFSKAFATMEQRAPNDMDAINTILDKVRENLVKDLSLALKQENAAITAWQREKKRRRRQINQNWTKTWKEYKTQGQTEQRIGRLWSQAGAYQIAQAKAQKSHDENQILHEFLRTRCKNSRRAFIAAMASYNNELNALSRVTEYLKTNVFGKKGWGKSIMATISKPYKWKNEGKPNYVSVKGTYSAIGNGYDSQSCRQSFKTTFQKLRILTQDRTNQAYIDPNDLTHSSNMVDGSESKHEGKMNCQLFPGGLPVGRAATCTTDGKPVKATINLRGTKYMFGSAALKMFKVLGHKTANSKVKISKDKQKITLFASGRCADLYGDDVSAADADYRSDPIPLETVTETEKTEKE